MYNISLSDQLFATVTSMHTTICNMSMNGVTSMGEIVKRVMATIGDEAMGGATLTVRNSSRGWAVKHTLRRPRITEPRQLTLAI